MRALACLLLLSAGGLADEASDRSAIRKVIATFNLEHERASVLEPNADTPDLARCWRQEVSPIYFELKTVRFVTADVALADASANRYGMGKQTSPAYFVLKREGAEWKIDSLRMAVNCVSIVPLRFKP